ncbi:MAG: hypothetical protein G3M78_05615 [Candidatus Nitrohelix vancouverensis]|uniref:Uncharacterized protein n=1 Tax=Candidatus Nitrohelix vancouverensis TaxID=2705534 RepID=A0A7T0C1M2_9BACT|nr:MAG: hypothetical protein G3M78_05615 [Candidatus Nitrohelix vancouverensis]
MNKTATKQNYNSKLFRDKPAKQAQKSAPRPAKVARKSNGQWKAFVIFAIVMGMIAFLYTPNTAVSTSNSNPDKVLGGALRR